MSIYIVIIEDHTLIRQALELLLSLDRDVEVIGVAQGGIEGVEKTYELKPDVVVMDVILPDLNGLEATKLIKQKLPATRVIVWTGYHSNQLKTEALECGAECCFSKNEDTNLLLRQIKQKNFSN